MHKGIAISAAALAVTALTVTPAAADPPLAHGPDGVTMEIATVNGSGCPVGTSAVAMSDDKDAFTVTYSDYMAQAGGSSNPVDSRKNCHISLRVHVPRGFTYAISSIDYRGFTYLPGGAQATVAASYYFQGHPQTGVVSRDIKGAYSDNWQFTHQSPLDQLIYKPCGEERNFNISTELRVDEGTANPSKVSFIAMDSTDGSIRTTYHFAWKRC